MAPLQVFFLHFFLSAISFFIYLFIYFFFSSREFSLLEPLAEGQKVPFSVQTVKLTETMSSLILESVNKIDLIPHK